MFSYKLYMIGERNSVNKGIRAYYLDSAYHFSHSGEKRFQPEMLYAKSCYVNTNDLRAYEASQSLLRMQARLLANQVYFTQAEVEFTPEQEKYIRFEQLFTLPISESDFVNIKLPWMASPESSPADLKEAYALVCVNANEQNFEAEKKDLKKFLKYNAESPVFLIINGPEPAYAEKMRIAALLDLTISEENIFILDEPSRVSEDLIKKIIKLQAAFAIPAILKTLEDVLCNSTTRHFYSDQALRKNLLELKHQNHNPDSVFQTLSMAYSLIDQTKMRLDGSRSMEIMILIGVTLALTAIITTLIFCPAGVFPLLVAAFASPIGAVLASIFIGFAVFAISAASVTAIGCKLNSDKDDALNKLEKLDLQAFNPVWKAEEIQQQASENQSMLLLRG